MVAVGTLVGVAVGIAVGVAVGVVAASATVGDTVVVAWSCGAAWPESTPTIKTVTMLECAGSARPAKVNSAWLTIRVPIAVVSLILVSIAISTPSPGCKAASFSDT